MPVAAITPMMQQYLAIKEQNRDSILFFRLGDFYEMFFEDAIEASRILHITLTSRAGGKKGKVPMCGIPFHAADNYIARLVRNGKKVAICEQVEAATPGKKLVRREIVKIITPGTFIADGLLDSSVNNYILAICPGDNNFGLAYSDISTGEFRVTEVATREDLFSELYKISPAECLIPENFSNNDHFQEIKDVNIGSITMSEDWMFDYGFSLKEIKEHFTVRDLAGFGCQDMSLAVAAAGALLKYLKNTQKSKLDNIDVISTYHLSQFMTMDWNSHRNLELIYSYEDASGKGTLFGVLDETKTPMGKRSLKKWILNPLLDTALINERLDAVQYFLKNNAKRHEVRELLGNIYDIDRLSNKVSLGSANARDMVSLSSSLKNIKALRNLLDGALPEKLGNISEELDDFGDIIKWIDECVADEPPVSLRDGGLVAFGYDTEVDELRDIVNGGKDWIIQLQKKEIERTGISSLKVGYNRVFGYYIEVTNTNLDSIPENYIRKQTLANAERFITGELKDHESKVIMAGERMKSVEYDIFLRLREKVGGEIERLKRTAGLVAEVDVITCLSEAAVKNNYVRPCVDQDGILDVKDGRHPVLEKLLKDKEFVPNDIVMGGEAGNMFVITGSNMAGKSTYIRQVALITIMAQMGSFVPASSAVIGVVDRVFTRVGASDRLYKGMSTFMVEMLETANILNNATGRSLIILDEIGRGTSTYDGVSIAWAVMEYINEHLTGSKTLFATHFHELTELAGMLPGVKNYNLAIREWKEEVIFLYKVVEGSCDESFGIHVAKLAGMPLAVVRRSREILNNLQKDSLLGNMRNRFSHDNFLREKQLDLFEQKAGDAVIRKIREMDIDNLTPFEALSVIVELKKETR